MFPHGEHGKDVFQGLYPETDYESFDINNVNRLVIYASESGGKVPAKLACVGVAGDVERKSKEMRRRSISAKEMARVLDTRRGARTQGAWHEEGLGSL